MLSEFRVSGLRSDSLRLVPQREYRVLADAQELKRLYLNCLMLGVCGVGMPNGCSARGMDYFREVSSRCFAGCGEFGFGKFNYALAMPMEYISKEIAKHDRYCGYLAEQNSRSEVCLTAPDDLCVQGSPHPTRRTRTEKQEAEIG